MTDRSEELQTLLAMNATVDAMKHGLNLILQGGEEGIKEAAEIAPELIIYNLQTLVELVDVMQQNYNEVVLENHELRDQLEQTRP